MGVALPILSASLTSGKYPDNQQQQNRYCQEWCDLYRIDLSGIGTDTYIAFLLIGDSVSPNQKSVGINSIWSTCYQCTEILSFLNLEVGKIGRFHNADLIHLIGEGGIQCM